MNTTNAFKAAAADRSPLESRDPFDNDLLLDSTWADDDDDINAEFGKKTDSLGHRVYEVFLDV